MTLAEVVHCGHLEAWSMPFRYAMTVLDIAIERSEAERESDGDRLTRPVVSKEPVVTEGGVALPPGMSQMARMFGFA
jgi:hypothetical protein